LDQLCGEPHAGALPGAARLTVGRLFFAGVINIVRLGGQLGRFCVEVVVWGCDRAGWCFDLRSRAVNLFAPLALIN
jgi:hypothetical protein